MSTSQERRHRAGARSEPAARITTITSSSPVPLEALPPLRTRTRTDTWAPLVAAAVAVASMLWNLKAWPRVEDDEGTYVGQADAVFDGALAPYTYIYDHPFIGWMQIAPLLEIVKAIGLNDISAVFAGRLVMVAFGGATAALIYLVTRRLGGHPVFALLACLLWTTSGLVHDAGRAVFLDNVGVTWVLLALYLALSPRQHMWHYVAAGTAFSAGVLSKETLAVFGPAVLLAVWQSSWKRLRVMHVVVFLASGVLFGLTYPLLATLKGELFPSSDRVSLLGTLVWQLGGRDGSGFLWEDGSARQQILAGWMSIDGALLTLGALASVVCLIRPAWRPLGLAALVAAAPPLLLSGYMPPMYHLALIPVFAVAVGLALSLLSTSISKAWRGRRTVVGATRLVGLSAVLVLLAAFGSVAVPDRVDRMSTVWTSNGVGEYYQTREWALANIPVGDPVITNGELWNDFHDAGWASDEVVPYTKVDRDPALDSYRPRWIVLTPTMARDVAADVLAHRVRRALDEAAPVVAFGDYVVYRID